jgi:hypothetical protein
VLSLEFFLDWFTSNQMKVNPDKFQAIAIGKNTQSKNISFNLNGNIIKTEDEVKLRGTMYVEWFSLYINFSALS